MKNKSNISKISYLIAFCLILAGVLYSREIRAQFDSDDLEKLKKDNGKSIILVDRAKNVSDAISPWTLSEEIAIGRDLAARVAYSYGGIWRGTEEADAWNVYVNKIGRGMVYYSARPGIKHRFAVLNSDDVNSYSCPGGYIFITKGTLRSVRNEGELAGVIAYHIASISERQVEQAVRSKKIADLAIDLAAETAYNDHKFPKIESKSSSSVTLADIVFEAAFSSPTNEKRFSKEAIKNQKESYDVFAETALSKIDVFEADKEGTKILVKMGYDPSSLVGFFEILLDMKENKINKHISNMTSHPHPEKRIKKIEKLLIKNGWNKIGGYKGEDRLQSMKDQYPID